MTIAKGKDWLDRYKKAAGRPHPLEVQLKREQAQKGPEPGSAEAARARLAEIGKSSVIKKLQAEYEATDTRSTELLRDFKRIRDTEGAFSDEADEAYRRFKREYDRQNELRGEIRKAEKQLNERAHETLAVDDPVSLNTKMVSRFSKSDSRHDAIQEGVGFVQKMLGVQPDSPDVAIEFKKGGRGRSSADALGTRINLTTHSGPSTVVHEIGHWLEHNVSSLRDKAFAFYDRRTEGEALVSMNSVTSGGYSGYERTRPDDFLNPYMGKDYSTRSRGRYATEILSMGIEKFYEDPIGFAKQDPDYFDFIYGALRGQ
jgi:hypothetical protein